MLHLVPQGSTVCWNWGFSFYREGMRTEMFVLHIGSAFFSKSKSSIYA